MDCREASLLISPHLDGALSKDEEAALTEHVAVCEGCARELELQKRLSCALHGLGREEILAPPELCGLVMAKLRKEHRGVLRWMPAAWRKAAAAVAAVLLIAGSYAGVTAGLAGGGKIVVDNTTAPKVNMEPGGRVAPGEASKDGLSQPDGSTQPSDNNGNPVNNGEGNTTGGDPANGAGNSNNTGNNTGSSKTPAVSPTTPSAEGSTALLSSGMKVTSTLLKLAVDDLTGARAKAVALAAGAGAETQVFPEQSGGKKIVVIRLTTTSNQAQGLMSGLARVGTLVDRQDDSKDITAIYNETLVQYRDLQVRISNARDARERSQMEIQAASYKQQLDTWESEAGKQVIMLWLESR